MGADLYINPLYETNYKRHRPSFDRWVKIRETAIPSEKQKAAQKKVDKYYDLMNSKGYFRDSYNGTNVLNRLGLSWWKDISKLQDKDGVISVDNVRKFLALITPLPVKPLTPEELKELHLVVDNGDNSPDAWQKSWIEHKQELIAFLKEAIRLNNPIEASL